MRAPLVSLFAALLLALSPGLADAGGAKSRARSSKPAKAEKSRHRSVRPRAGHQKLGYATQRFDRGREYVAQFEAGLPSASFVLRSGPGAWGKQRQSQWCWAATSQMVLNYHGLPVSQEAVITRAFGGYIDRPATTGEIAATLHGWTLSHGGGRGSLVAAASYEGLPTEAVARDLAAGKPLIVGLKNPDGNGGHAYVLTSVKYNLNAAGQPVAVSAKLRDPWPTNPSQLELSWAEINQRFLGAVRIDVAHY